MFEAYRIEAAQSCRGIVQTSTLCRYDGDLQPARLPQPSAAIKVRTQMQAKYPHLVCFLREEHDTRNI